MASTLPTHLDGRYRSFRFRNTASAHKGLIVIFILHGSGGTGKDMMSPSAGLQKIEVKERLLLVYPDGL